MHEAQNESLESEVIVQGADWKMGYLCIKLLDILPMTMIIIYLAIISGSQVIFWKLYSK